MRPLLVVIVLSLVSASAYLALTHVSWANPAPADAVHRTAMAMDTPPANAVEREVASEEAERPVQTRFHTRAYAVGGGTAGEILGSLLSAGPRVGNDAFFGLTEAEMDLHFRTVESDGACELRAARVLLDLTVTLPEWEAPRDPDPALARDWRQFRRALVRHENEHRRIAVRGADELYRAVQGLRRSTCAEADAEGRRRVDQLQAEVEAAHRRFDDETGHGRTQGAVWPLE